MTTRPTVLGHSDDVIIIGSGLAGLACALSLAPQRVKLITKTPGLAGGSSLQAKGGIAAAVGPGDSPEQHAADTLAAGAGLCDAARALGLAEEGAEALEALLDAGIPFDRALDGTLALAREAAHGRPRVAHAGGDATGEVVITGLVDRVLATPSIDVYAGTFALQLDVDRNQVRGVITIDPTNGLVVHRASRVVLATGGIGMAWWQTTNPAESTGDGLAIAARAGARLADLEFVQFHPTALDAAGDGTSLPLLTEALRGAGALLVDADRQRFMPEEHPAAELAPRDIVARAIHRRVIGGEKVFIDLRPVLEAGSADLFPQAFATAREAGLDPANDLLPIVPAAHYHMGGIQVSELGRTSVDGLWACGEAATTGIHGANRLASNSLLEALVYARHVAQDIAKLRTDSAADRIGDFIVHGIAARDAEPIVTTVRKTMSRHVGITRSAAGLDEALAILGQLEDCLMSAGSAAGDVRSAIRFAEAHNLILVGRLVTLAAMQRTESRGAHYRQDYPTTHRNWLHRQVVTLVENRCT